MPISSAQMPSQTPIGAAIARVPLSAHALGMDHQILCSRVGSTLERSGKVKEIRVFPTDNCRINAYCGINGEHRDRIQNLLD